MEKLESVIFYTIDRAIRTYRQYAQAQLKKHGFTITIDQWLIIKCLLENPAITQIEISERVFKDNASVTRIINLLVKAKYVTRKISKSDRRRTVLTVTQLGIDTITAIDEIVKINRAHALNGLNQEEIAIASKVMEVITSNCKK
ncbi:MAG: MarR family transcriptional regulator [Fluviicola sp.]|jgi:MarR family transcriptional regulator for hemolysin|nr:MarR family transcriptional regulator [Fluviicola sp.]